MGEKFCRMAGVHVAIHIVCNQINIDCEHPNPTKSIYCTRMSVSSFGSANQITSDAREEKKSISSQWCWPPARDDVVVPAQAEQ